MKQEYSFTLTVPLLDIDRANTILAETKQSYPVVRVSRKTDRKNCARFYLSFPFSQSRPDLSFQEWIGDKLGAGWDLFGPTYGRWGLS